MNIKEINEQKWKVSPNLKVHYIKVTGLTLLEQECGFLILRVGITDKSKSEVQVNCADQTVLTELKNCEYLTVTEVEVSDNPRAEGFIVRLQGLMPENALTIRKKIPVFSEEEKQRRKEHAKKYLSGN
jgi:hypothetical protein